MDLTKDVSVNINTEFKNDQNEHLAEYEQNYFAQEKFRDSSNTQLENLNKSLNLKIPHHICENTTTDSKVNIENDGEYNSENLNIKDIIKDINENYNENEKIINIQTNKKIENFEISNISKIKNGLPFSNSDYKISLPLLGRKIFRIKKYTKYDKYLNEICTESEHTDEEKNKLKDPKAKKISPFSKVNFSKLKVEEKDERLKNLAKLVKRLRRKVRNLENKVRFNASKLLNKYVWTKLGINTKNKYVPPEFSFDFDKICRALKRVRNHEDFEFADQKHLIENLINVIAEDKLKLDSLSYKRICSEIRMFLNKDQIKYISKKNSKVTVTFPETEVYITKAEYNKLKKYKDKEDILRAVLGVYDQDEKTIKISIDSPEEKKKEEKTEPSNCLKKFHKEEQKKNSFEFGVNVEEKFLNNKIFSTKNNKIDENSILNNNNILNQKMNYIIQNHIESAQSKHQNVSNINFENNIASMNNKNSLNNKNQNYNNLIFQNFLGSFPNNLFGLPINPINNSQKTEPYQDAFPYNLLQNTNNLYGANFFNCFNNNYSNVINPLQYFLMNNSQNNYNQQPQSIINNILFKQKNASNFTQQNENNIFTNFSSNNNNNNIKSPKNKNLFFDNQNSSNSNNNIGNNNLFSNKEDNSSYNVFLK